MGTYILGGSNTNDDTGVLNAQGDINALSDVIVTEDLTVNGNATISTTLTSPNINASTSPLDLQVAGSTVATLDSSGDLTIDGWNYAKGRNRLYYQDLTISTFTPSSTPTLIGESITITPKFSGHIVIDAVVGVNVTVSGVEVNVTIFNGSTGINGYDVNAPNTPVNNYPEAILHYELSNQPIGTPITLSLYLTLVSSTSATVGYFIEKFVAEEI